MKVVLSSARLPPFFSRISFEGAEARLRVRFGPFASCTRVNRFEDMTGSSERARAYLIHGRACGIITTAGGPGSDKFGMFISFPPILQCSRDISICFSLRRGQKEESVRTILQSAGSTEGGYSCSKVKDIIFMYIVRAKLRLY